MILKQINEGSTCYIYSTLNKVTKKFYVCKVINKINYRSALKMNYMFIKIFFILMKEYLKNNLLMMIELTIYLNQYNIKKIHLNHIFLWKIVDINCQKCCSKLEKKLSEMNIYIIFILMIYILLFREKIKVINIFDIYIYL